MAITVVSSHINDLFIQFILKTSVIKRKNPLISSIYAILGFPGRITYGLSVANGLSVRCVTGPGPIYGFSDF